MFDSVFRASSMPPAYILLLHYSLLALVWTSILQRLPQTQDTRSSFLSAFPVNVVLPIPSTAENVPVAQLSSNLSRYESNVSATTPSAVCDGIRYGREVKSGSCIDALEIIPDLERTVSFGPRNQGSFMLGPCVFADTTV